MQSTDPTISGLRSYFGIKYVGYDNLAVVHSVVVSTISLTKSAYDDDDDEMINYWKDKILSSSIVVFLCGFRVYGVSL